MTVYKLLNKNRNKNNIITSYTLIDQQGKRVDVNPIELKAAIKGKKVKVLGLTLTSDFRLVDGAAIKEKQPAPVKKPEPQSKPVEPVGYKYEIIADFEVNNKKKYVLKNIDPRVRYLYVEDEKRLGNDSIDKRDKQKSELLQKMADTYRDSEYVQENCYDFVLKGCKALSRICREANIKTLAGLFNKDTDEENMRRLASIIKKYDIEDQDIIERALSLCGTMQFTGDLRNDPIFLTKAMKQFNRRHYDISDMCYDFCDMCGWFVQTMKQEATS